MKKEFKLLVPICVTAFYSCGNRNDKIYEDKSGNQAGARGGLVEISTGEYIINALNNDYDTIVRCVKSYTPSSDSDDEDEEEDIEDDDEHVKIWSSIIEDYKLRIFELTEEDIDDDDVALFRKNFITNPQKSKYRYESHMDFYYVDKLLNLFRSRLSEEEFFIAKANITGEYLARWADGSSEWLSEKN